MTSLNSAEYKLYLKSGVIKFKFIIIQQADTNKITSSPGNLRGR